MQRRSSEPKTPAGRGQKRTKSRFVFAGLEKQLTRAARRVNEQVPAFSKSQIKEPNGRNDERDGRYRRCVKNTMAEIREHEPSDAECSDADQDYGEKDHDQRSFGSGAIQQFYVSNLVTRYEDGRMIYVDLRDTRVAKPY